MSNPNLPGIKQKTIVDKASVGTNFLNVAPPTSEDAKLADLDLATLDPSMLKSIQINFSKELEDSIAGKKTSLPFILHSLSPTPLVAENETFQVMVVGGSVFKEALAKKKKGHIIFLNKKQENLPVFHTEDNFVALIERHLDQGVRVVALNFAFPLVPVFENNKLDGILQSGSKEHAFAGLVGERVGGQLEQYFRRKYKREISFIVANDTVCLLLSGLGKASWENLAGGIVGTGVNFAFFLSNTNLVNLESKDFDKFPISNETKELDLRSAQIGKALFEKETAGGYLYQHFNSMVTKHQLPYPPLSSTWELKKLALSNDAQISSIARSLIKKSASLIAAVIAGITLFKNHDMTFVMEGSFFWNEDIYREYVEQYLKALIPERKITFVFVTDSPFLGAAKLVC